LRKIDFEALFELLPSPYMLLDRELRYVAVNRAYEREVGRERREMLGRFLFEAFPNSDEGGRMLRASFERVLTSGQPDTIAYIPYAVAKNGGAAEMRYWSAVHTPVTDDDGEVAFILQNTVDVTELRHLQDIAYGAGPKQLLQRAQELQQANLSLLQESTELRDLFMQAPGFIAVLSGEDLTFTLVNHAYQQLIGHRPVIGKTILEALPEMEGQEFIGLLQTVMHTRQPFIGRAMAARLSREPGAGPEERFVDFVYQPILGADGEAVGVFVEGSDVTDRVRGEEQQKLLLDELNHRVKNTLATVQSIAAQTLRTSPEPKTFRETFEARLMALSATHDLLTATSWRGASLRDVLAVEFRPYGAERYVFDGPDVELSSNEALTLGLIFHELATNAAKYGALSRPDGCVGVRWEVRRAGRGAELHLEWLEQNGPAVSPPTRRGFGSRLIERSLRRELHGEAAMEFRPEGLRCTVRAPLRLA
jgi:PAS domain S-box-containing protein